jgi:hypothetical protein
MCPLILSMELIKNLAHIELEFTSTSMRTRTLNLIGLKDL